MVNQFTHIEFEKLSNSQIQSMVNYYRQYPIDVLIQLIQEIESRKIDENTTELKKRINNLNNEIFSCGLSQSVNINWNSYSLTTSKLNKIKTPKHFFFVRERFT